MLGVKGLIDAHGIFLPGACRGVALGTGRVDAAAALFVVADALGCRCGSCFHVIWNQEREAAGLDQTMSEDTSSAVRVAVEALKRLIKADRAAETAARAGE